MMFAFNKILKPVSQYIIRKPLFLFSHRKPNYYQILNVSHKASPEQIKISYYSLVKKYHPDVSKQNSEHIKLLNEAYSVLSDDKARQKYDAQQGISSSPFDYSKVNERPYYQYYRPSYHYPPHQNESKTYKKNKRVRGDPLTQMYVQNFVIGFIMTGLIVVFFGKRPEQAKNGVIKHQLGKKYTRMDFQKDFQQSLIFRKT